MWIIRTTSFKVWKQNLFSWEIVQVSDFTGNIRFSKVWGFSSKLRRIWASKVMKMRYEEERVSRKKKLKFNFFTPSKFALTPILTVKIFLHNFQNSSKVLYNPYTKNTPLHICSHTFLLFCLISFSYLLLKSKFL